MKSTEVPTAGDAHLAAALPEGETPRGALIIQPLLGLANRLRAVASAHLTAAHAGRALFLDWRADAGCNATWADLFENPIPSFPGPLGAGVREFRDVAGNFAEPGPGDLAIAPEEVVLVSTYFNFKPRGMPMSRFLEQKSTFYRELVPVSSVREQLEQLRARGLRGSRVIGVHIRRGDLQHVTVDPPDYVSPTMLFIRRMKKLLAEDPDTQFFLATDDRREEERILAEFPDRVLTQIKRHAARDQTEGMREALVDWLALAETSRIIHSHLSSFSREAAVAGRIPAKPVRRFLWPYCSYRKWMQIVRKGPHR